MSGLCHFLTLLLLTVAAQAAPKWDPISKEELAEQKPKVDPDAGAEILLREVVMDHSSPDASEDTYYVRAKIYTQLGVSDFAKIENKQQLVIERAIEFSDATIPAPDYESVRMFFEKILQAEQAPVVLRKN